MHKAVIALLPAIVGLACTGEPGGKSSSDGDSGRDAGALVDGGALDGGAHLDAGTADSGPRPDSGTPDGGDAGLAWNAGNPD